MSQARAVLYTQQHGDQTGRRQAARNWSARGPWSETSLQGASAHVQLGYSTPPVLRLAIASRHDASAIASGKHRLYCSPSESSMLSSNPLFQKLPLSVSATQHPKSISASVGREEAEGVFKPS
mmetsp:Transcript_42946/g.97074  ORF Transcript_42946/g.97074 Transcript_42946/m.97074 type:complete len:123 (-) Transcript_42946:1199-1567(-)